jgi:gamma-glutamyltranspeptidase
VARAKLISASMANCNVPVGTPEGTDNGTTYLSVVDKEGNLISFIQSNYSTVGFGAGLTVADAGFVWHNRGGGFSLDAASPNLIAGRKRPLHTIIPGFMEKGDEKIAFGIMGGWNQSQAHAQFVANLVDFGMNIQGALDAPRFFLNQGNNTFTGGNAPVLDPALQHRGLASSAFCCCPRPRRSGHFHGGSLCPCRRRLVSGLVRRASTHGYLGRPH